MSEQEAKQVIVIRKDLNMSKGKIAVQASHASMKVLLELMRVESGITNDHHDYFNFTRHTLAYCDDDAIASWLSGKFKKICVSVNSEEELLEILEQAKEANLLCSLITDEGLTEFNGVPTNTCIAIGPNWSDEIDKITRELKLL